MLGWRRKRKEESSADAVEALLRKKYASFRTLLSLNNECLELMAGVQEDLRHVAPMREVFSGRVTSVFENAGGIIESLEKLLIDFGRAEDARNDAVVVA